MHKPLILQIALPIPLKHHFDYLLPVDFSETVPPLLGVRVQVPFGKKKLIGLLIGLSEKSDVPLNKLKPAYKILDQRPVLSDSLFKLIQWASQYYHHPLGEVIKNSLPKKIREGEDLQKNQIIYLLHSDAPKTKLSSVQKNLVEFFKQHPKGVNYISIKEAGFQDKTLITLEKQNWIFQSTQEISDDNMSSSIQFSPGLSLQTDQANALQIINQCETFNSFLLDGVTGSGKTEVYLQAIAKRLSEKKQALVLVPEIALTPQTIQRFQARFSCKMAVFHSRVTDQEKWNSWASAESGEASIIIGTRSAIFAPLKNLGIIIVDEEHDSSFKQQTGFRYSARDLAVIRAHMENIPIILGSATPSLESFYNVQLKKFTHLTLKQRANKKPPPNFYLIDIKNQKLNAGLSKALLMAMEKHLKEKNQVLIFLNRRGYSPVLLCHSCSWIAFCKYCDAKMVWHHQAQRLFCHHCSFNMLKPSRCPECDHSELMMVGTGTEKLEQALSDYFKHYSVIRIDKDTTRLKGAMQNMLEKVHEGESQILIGTQMLAKGHHFPNLTMVAILDGDSGLYSADFKASERMAQLIIQVAGRAGRGEKAGEVYIQTHHPEHPWLKTLLQKDYETFANELISERKLAHLPPFYHLAVLRAEAKTQENALAFLNKIKTRLKKFEAEAIQVSSPIPAWMEKKLNVYRAILLISASKRPTLHAYLNYLEQYLQMPEHSKTSWSLEVDPLEIL